MTQIVPTPTSPTPTMEYNSLLDELIGNVKMLSDSYEAIVDKLGREDAFRLYDDLSAVTASLQDLAEIDGQVEASSKIDLTFPTLQDPRLYR